MHRPRIGVIRGGPSNEYDVSLGTGASVLRALRNNHSERYRIHDILIDKAGVWHMDGMPLSPNDIIHKIDVAFNALHGSYGEDGKIQSFFEHHHFPFTGTKSLGAALAMNKAMAKKILQHQGIKTPYWKEVTAAEANEDEAKIIQKFFHTFLLPAVVKPASSGSSVGVSIVRSYGEFPSALKLAAEHGDNILIEEYIPGVEATVGVIEGFRDHELYALPPVEIRPHAGFFDYDAKYKGKSQEIVPSNFSDDIKKELEELAGTIHRILNLRHYSRSDFIVHPKRGIYALEANALPGLTEESLLPKSLRAIGSDLHELVDHLIQLALPEHRRKNN